VQARHSNSDVPSPTGKSPDVRQFKPSQFAKLVDRVDKLNFGIRDDLLRRWLEYWTKQHKGREALKAVESFFKNTERTYPAEIILDDVFLTSLAVQGKKEAYKWLVRAHAVRRGWHNYWTSEDEVVKRLEWAARYYKSRWRDFIRDTSKPEPFWEKRDYGFSIGLEYLVRFLILVDQQELAAQYTDTLVGILVEEVSDQPLPEIPWLQ
jgi:hypothetical protein